MIKFIYFDIGGVLIQDFSSSDRWDQMLSDLKIVGDKRLRFEKLWKKFSPWITTNQDVDDLIEVMNRELEITLPKNYSVLNDFVSRFTQNRSLWPLIDRLKGKTKFGLLSNLYPRMLQKIKESSLLPPIDWDVVIDSSTIGLQKPDPAIFEYAIQKAAVPANQILFVDNTQENIESAKKLGLQTFFYDFSNYDQSAKDLSTFIKQNI